MNNSEPGSFLDNFKIATVLLMVVSFLTSVGFLIAGIISASRSAANSAATSFSSVFWHNAHHYVIVSLISRGIFIFCLIALIVMAMYEDQIRKSDS